MRWTSRRIEVIRLLSQTMSMTETARLMFITQPAVSQILREMEDEAGFRFFERRGNRIRMTTETMSLLPVLDRIDDEFQKLAARTGELKDATSGHIAIGSMGPLASGLVAQTVAGFTAKRPSVNFSIDTLGSGQIIERVRQERIDLGITLKTNEDIGLVLEPLLKTQAVAVLKRSHPLAARDHITIDDLKDHPVVCHGPSTPLGIAIRDTLGPAKFDRLSKRIDTNQSSTAISVALSGQAIALTHPLNSGLLQDPRLAVRAILPEIPLVATLVLSRNRPVSRLLSTFIAALIAQAKIGAEEYKNSGLVMEISL